MNSNPPGPVLLTGSNGQLGRSLQRVTESGGSGIEWYPTDVSELDITSLDAVQRTVESISPRAIVNAAAYTAVDKAEDDVEVATRVNVDGPRNLAIAAKERGIRLVHVSTDYVFDGEGTTPFREDDTPAPQSVYGRTKLEGEQSIREIGVEHATIRVSWLFSEFGPCFPMTMRRLAVERPELRVVADQRGCPTYAGDLADLIVRMLGTEEWNFDLYHFCSRPETTWHGFAERAIALCREQEKVLCESVVPITTAEFPTRATRPAFSVLSTERVMAEFGSIPDWGPGLARSVAAYRSA